MENKKNQYKLFRAKNAKQSNILARKIFVYSIFFLFLLFVLILLDNLFKLIWWIKRKKI